jgi:hypothetical protein
LSISSVVSNHMLTIIITLAGVTPGIGADSYSFLAAVHKIAVTPSALFIEMDEGATSAKSIRMSPRGGSGCKSFHDYYDKDKWQRKSCMTVVRTGNKFQILTHDITMVNGVTPKEERIKYTVTISDDSCLVAIVSTLITIADTGGGVSALRGTDALQGLGCELYRG